MQRTQPLSGFLIGLAAGCLGITPGPILNLRSTYRRGSVEHLVCQASMCLAVCLG